MYVITKRKYLTMKYQKTHHGQSISFTCLACRKIFDSNRGLSLHNISSSYCLEMSQLVQKLSTTIPEFKQTKFATTQQIVSNNLEEGAYNNQECQNSEIELDVMCNNDNIEQTTNQIFIFHKIFFMK